MARKENHSVKDELEKALLRLLGKKSYMDITVSDLVKEAQVARVSFYRNFSSISDVIDSIAEQTAVLFAKEIIPLIACKDERKWREFLFYYFYQFARNPKQYETADSTGSTILQKKLNEKVEQTLENQTEISSWNMYSLLGKLGLLESISHAWAVSGMKETPEEMIDYIMPVIKAF